MVKHTARPRLQLLEDRTAPASSIAIIAGVNGTGSLDGFLTGSGGTVLATDGGAAPGTLSTGALAAIPGANDISVTAQSSITFNDLASGGGVLNLTTSAGHSATFTAGSGSLTFANTANTVNTAGGNLTLSANTNESVGQIGTLGGNLTLTATNGTLTQSGNASAATVNVTAGGNVTLDNLTGTTVTLTSGGGSVQSAAGATQIGASTQLGVSAATGINVRTSATTMQAATTGSGNVNIANNSDLTITGPISTAATASVTLSAGGAEGLLTLQSAITSGSVTLTANRMDLSAGSIDVGVGAANSVTLRPTTLNRPVNLDNTAGDPTGQLRLSNAELGTITAGVLRVGRIDDTADLFVKSAIFAPLGWSTLDLISRGIVGELGGGTVTAGSLAAQGRTAVAFSNNAVSVGAFAATSAGSIDLANAGDLAVTAVDGVTGVTSTGLAGDVTLQLQGAGNTLTVNSPITSSNPTLTLAADDMQILAAVDGGSGLVQLSPFGTPNLTIDLGTNTPGTLGLTDAELDRVTAGLLRIGSSAPQAGGTATVSAPITQAGSGYTALSVNVAGGILNTGGSLAVNNLALSAGAGIGAVGTPLVTAATKMDFINSGGVVNISNTGNLVITPLDTVGPASNSGTTTALATTGSLTLTVNVTGIGAVVLTTTDSGSATDNLIVNPGVTLSTTGVSTALTLQADDGLTLPASAVVSATGPATLIGGVGGTGALVTVLGKVAGSTASVKGGAGNDTLTVSLAAGSAANVVVDGQGGADTLAITPSATSALIVHGGVPTPPALPGDRLVVNLLGAGGPAVSSSTNANGKQGTWTFTNRQSITFDGIETLTDVNSPNILVFAADSGAAAHVVVHDNITGSTIGSFFAYDPSFTGGARVASADVNGDDVTDIIVGAGPGGGPHVKVIDGSKLTQTLANGVISDSALLASFFAYAPSFTGGIFVAAGDVTGDGKADIVTSAGAGGGPHVKVLDGTKLTQVDLPSGVIQPSAQVASFFAYDPSFTGGARVAVGDVNGDGKADVITGAGVGGGPHVKVIDGTKLALTLPNGQISDSSLLFSFFAFSSTFTSGIFVAAGDVGGNGKADLLVGQDNTSVDTRVREFDGATGNLLTEMAPYGGGNTPNGIRVAMTDWNNDGLADLVFAPGPATTHTVHVFSGSPPAPIAGFEAFDTGFLGGVFVG
ncbi:MAG: hypothetical protein ACJ8F7_05475 [Gemmataceae bacterium]